jgi:hypothetical protein
MSRRTDQVVPVSVLLMMLLVKHPIADDFHHCNTPAGKPCKHRVKIIVNAS